MKLSIILLALCIVTTSAQITNYATCLTSSWTNFWTFFWNPFYANFGSGVTDATTCSNLVGWINYLLKYYAWGGSGYTATCTSATGGTDSTGKCKNGMMCTNRPNDVGVYCSVTLTNFGITGLPTFTNLRDAFTWYFTKKTPPTAAPISACECPFLNIPNAMTSNFVDNLNAWWAASWSTPAGYYLALFINGTNFSNYYCAAISKCPNGQISVFP